MKLTLKLTDVREHKFHKVGHTYLDSNYDFGWIEEVL